MSNSHSERPPRFKTQVKASLEVYGRNGLHIVDMVNLSQSGACLAGALDNLDIHIGDVVRMTVFLKALNRRHEVSAEVMWIEGKKSGVNFLKPEQVLARLSDRSS